MLISRKTINVYAYTLEQKGGKWLIEKEENSWLIKRKIVGKIR